MAHFLKKIINIFKFMLWFLPCPIDFLLQNLKQNLARNPHQLFAQKLRQASPMGSALGSRLCGEIQTATSCQCFGDVTRAADFGTQCMRGVAACRCIANARKVPSQCTCTATPRSRYVGVHLRSNAHVWLRVLSRAGWRCSGSGEELMTARKLAQLDS